MIRKIVPFLMTLFALLLVACSPDSDGSISVAPTADSMALATPALTVTPEPSLTVTIAPTMTPSPAPSETPELCDESFLREVLLNLGKLDSYRSLVEIQAIDSVNKTVYLSLSLEMATILGEKGIDALDIVMQTEGQSDIENIHMILVAERVYFQTETDETWQVLEGETSDAMLSRFADSQFLRPELVDNLAEAACHVSSEEIDGTMFQIYNYSDIDFAGISNMRGLTLEDVGAELESSSLEIWLIGHEEMIIPTRLETVFFLNQSGSLMEYNMTESVFDINAPFQIAVPENIESPVFFLDLPLPEDAEVFTEGENVLIFTTLMPSDETQLMYIDYLSNDGWIETDAYPAEEQGILFSVVEMSKPGLGIAVAVGEQSDLTVVSIAGGEEQK